MVLRGFERVGGLEGFLERIEAFHGFRAPGVVLGGFMVDLAAERMKDHELADAVVETAQCLVDAVQLLTPCTVGNGWVTVIDAGRFALTLYDKETREGVRVFLDHSRLGGFPEIAKWFFRTVPKREQPLEVLNGEIVRAGRSVLAEERVRLSGEFGVRRHAPKPRICTTCGEAYRGEDPQVCDLCRDPYYEVLPQRA
jgi:formylmethanofuran dehydrogenase subunit E